MQDRYGFLIGNAANVRLARSHWKMMPQTQKINQPLGVYSSIHLRANKYQKQPVRNVKFIANFQIGRA